MKTNMKIGTPVKQGRIYKEGHGYVIGYTVMVKGKGHGDAAKEASSAMAANLVSRDGKHWLASLIRREEYTKMTTYTFAEIV